MGRDSDAAGLKEDLFIQQALSRRQPRRCGAEFHTCNLGMMRCAHNPHLVWCGASNQRGGGGAGGGGGNGDAPGGGTAAMPFAGFGFLGFSIFRTAFGGGAAG
jgi:hypothetical protein